MIRDVTDGRGFIRLANDVVVPYHKVRLEREVDDWLIFAGEGFLLKMKAYNNYTLTKIRCCGEGMLFNLKLEEWDCGLCAKMRSMRDEM